MQGGAIACLTAISPSTCTIHSHPAQGFCSFPPAQRSSCSTALVPPIAVFISAVPLAAGKENRTQPEITCQAPDSGVSHARRSHSRCPRKPGMHVLLRAYACPRRARGECRAVWSFWNSILEISEDTPPGRGNSAAVMLIHFLALPVLPDHLR